MESENHSIRFIVADQEDLVTWTGELDKTAILEVLVYIKNQLRKKFSTESLVFSDIDGTQTDLEKILNTELTPIFVTLPQRPEIQTTTDVQPRTAQIIYNFKQADKVKVQKFENLKKYEEVDLGLSVIKTLNEASKKRNFEVEAELALAKQKILAANNPNGGTFGKNSQASVSQTGPQSQDEEKMITPEDLKNDDMSKRQKVQVHGNDGKSQWSFMNIFGKKQEEPKKGAMEAFTMEEVMKHNKRQDAWMVLNNKVYDVTNYIPFHPGGAKILAGVGRDATELYNKYHPWVNAEFLLAKYQVGYLKR